MNIIENPKAQATIINSFRAAMTKAESTVTVDNSSTLKGLQTEFCYVLKDIETGPSCDIPKLLIQVEQLTEKVKNL
ncbi:MAG: hypothetical protein ACREAU_00255 [Nitrosopumilaceae archaeon]